MTPIIKTDFLVIGSGIAGLTFALKAAYQFPDARIMILTKAEEGESNTKYAQGGVAVAIDEKDVLKHIRDTLKAGDGMCKEEIVEMVVKEGPRRVGEIIEWGANFDKNAGKYELGREGGHTANRIIHHKDSTGAEIVQTLLNKAHQMPNINIYSHHFAIDLITEHQIKTGVKRDDITCYGAYFLDQEKQIVERVLSRVTILATGGAGQVYGNTTNPLVATGDGIAMAYRAKAWICDMEFIQFHPTSLYNPSESPSFLISEAVRGFGAKLRTQDNELFMDKYDERGELASRDIVARAIDTELKKRGEKFVYLDCTHLDIEEFNDKFPNISEKCKSMGIDISSEMIPVVPAAHYVCGGIQTDQNGKTTIKGLYACGECAYTGLHGANRLASNSLLEALVFAHRCFIEAGNEFREYPINKSIPEWNPRGTTDPKEKILITHNRSELQEIMNDYVGIVRSDDRLHRALNRLNIIYEETKEFYDKTTLSPQLCELRNLVTIAYLIIQQSLKRKENRGAFYKID